MCEFVILLTVTLYADKQVIDNAEQLESRTIPSSAVARYQELISTFEYVDDVVLLCLNISHNSVLFFIRFIDH